MSGVITAVDAYDVRFPTSRELDGSDAMNPDPDYSATYVIVRTDAGDGLEGHGFCFTIGRGNEVEVAAVGALRPLVLGLTIDETAGDLGGLYRRLTSDSQLRWLGPEKGVMHMATAAVLNAFWDLAAKRAGKPVWKFLADMSPEQIVDLVDFRYLTDVLTREGALRILRDAEPGRSQREAQLRTEGYPAYTTSAGWLGYPDDKLARLCEQATSSGFDLIKLKVGADLDDDIRRCRIARETVGPRVRLAADANQRWDVDEAVRWMKTLAEFDLYWIEEPTSPDDILGHARIREAITPTRVATGEHVQNRVIFKQLLAAGAIDVLQLDATRVGGVNECVAILLLAAHHGIPVCPHAGGVGLCELVQHLSMFDFVALSGRMDNRVIEYVDHLHEHFHDPVVVSGGRYRLPELPGYSGQMKSDSLVAHSFPDGPAWAAGKA